MELLNSDFIKKYNLTLLKQEEINSEIADTLDTVVSSQGYYVDCFIFENKKFYSLICHCLDAKLYHSEILSQLCKQFITSYEKTKLKETKPFLCIVTKPKIYNSPIDENMDLNEVFDLFVYKWTSNEILTDFKEINVTNNADLLVRKYNDNENILNNTGIVVCNFNEFLSEDTVVFYKDMIEILSKNKQKPLIMKIIK